MKKLFRFLPLLALLLAPLCARAQTPTVVSGTVTGSDGIAWQGAQLTGVLVTAGGSQPRLTPCTSNVNNCPIQQAVPPTTLGPGGTFTINLYPNANILPASSTYTFNITIAGLPPPVGTGSQNCTLTGQTISGVTQTLTISTCPALSNIGGGGSLIAGNSNGIYLSPACPSPHGSNCYFAYDNGKSVCDAKLSSGSAAVNSPTAVWTAADLGKQVWATTLACSGFTTFLTSTVILTQTTITAITDSHDIVVGTNATGGGGTNTNTLVWGNDDTSNISTAFAAAQTFPCYPLILPAGMMLTSAGQFNGSGLPCYASTGTLSTGGQFGVAIMGQGMNATTIVPEQNFSYTQGAGNSCGGGAANTACFLGSQPGNMLVMNFQIWGSGLNGFSASANTHLVEFSQNLENSYLVNFQIVGWGANTSNTIGLWTAAAYSQLVNVGEDGAGYNGCEIANNLPGYASGLFCEDNTNESAIFNLQNTNGQPYFWLSNSTFGPLAAASGGQYTIQCCNAGSIVYSSNTSVQFTGVAGSVVGLNLGSGTWQGVGDQFVPAGNQIGVQLSGGTFREVNGTLGSSSSGTYGLYIETSGSVAYLQNTTLTGATHSLSTVAGTTVYDQGGNSLGNTISIAGALIADGHSVYGACTGTATSSSTLGLYGTGANETTTPCTSTTIGNGIVMNGARTLSNLIVTASHAGVNSSSGVVTVMRNGSTTTITCTIGTGTSCQDFTHTVSVSPGDLISIEFTTQASEVLAGVNAMVEWN